MPKLELTSAEMKALNALRRRPDAAVLEGVMVRAALAARDRYEDTPASEDNRMQWAAANDVVHVVFKQVI